MTAPRLPTRYRCGGCDNQWAGVSRAHCAACHRTFSAAGLFDKHRRQRTISGADDNPYGYCVDPGTILKAGEPTMRQTPDGLWRSSAEWVDVADAFSRPT